MGRIERSRGVQLAWIFGGVVVFALAGCGGPSTHPVEGKVTYQDGTPLSCGGFVIFYPIDPELKIPAPQGVIQEDGYFRMATYAEADGVPEGRYRVAVGLPVLKNPNKPPPNWPPFDLKYTNHEKSGLEFTVTRGKNEYHIILEK